MRCSPKSLLPAGITSIEVPPNNMLVTASASQRAGSSTIAEYSPVTASRVAVIVAPLLDAVIVIGPAGIGAAAGSNGA